MISANDENPATLDLGDPRRLAQLYRILHSHHRRGYAHCLRRGWDRDDLDQEVVTRVLARQAMPSRYDPAQSTLGAYLYYLTGGILLNLANLDASPEVPTDPAVLDDPTGNTERDPAGDWGPNARLARSLANTAPTSSALDLDAIVDAMPAWAQDVVARRMAGGRRRENPRLDQWVTEHAK